MAEASPPETRIDRTAVHKEDSPTDPARLTAIHLERKPIPYGAPAAPPVSRARDTKEGPKLVKIKLNGKELEVPAGTNLIEAARAEGVSIPYYCYHPGLTPAGNCRMCLVEASNSKKPITACTTPVTEGLEILTDSDNAKKARAGVLELMLINHPLDCPICDKAGECMLQDHTFQHGKDHSRMVEPKELKHTKEVGNDIYIWGNRCIVCTRCVRFCDEVAGTGELTVVERADHSVIDVFPGYPLQNALSGNVVDICPVGALISKEFLYQARVWYQKKTDSICTACARGCNIEIQTKDNKVKRLVPRHNPAVNDYWMCDYGRHDHEYVLGDRRTLFYRLGAPGGPADAAKALLGGLERVIAAHGPGSVGGIGSAFMTLEEAFLFQRLLGLVGAPEENIAASARPAGKEEVFRSGFRIAADKNPNRRGIEAIIGKDAFTRLGELTLRVKAGKVKGLIVVSDRPHCLLGEAPGEAGLLETLGELAFLAVFQLEAGAALPASAIVIPATAFPEKEGTMLNDDGRVQRLSRATEAPRGIRHEVDILQEVLRGLSMAPFAARKHSWDRHLPPEGIFRELAPLLGIPATGYRDLGRLGLAAGGAP